MSDRNRYLCGGMLLALSLALLLAGFLPFHSPEKALFRGKGSRFLPVSQVEYPAGMDILNHGNAEELTAFPGIGSFLAEEILKERLIHGAFRYPEDLMNVKGIGVKKMEQIRQMLLAMEDESED